MLIDNNVDIDCIGMYFIYCSRGKTILFLRYIHLIYHWIREIRITVKVLYASKISNLAFSYKSHITKDDEITSSVTRNLVKLVNN